MNQSNAKFRIPLTFQESAKVALANTQLRRNMGKATQTICGKRHAVVHEMPDWQELREAGRAIKQRPLRHLDDYLLQLEESVQRAGGHVHWARDAIEANQIVARIVLQHGAKEVIKVKSLTTDEIRMNEALSKLGVTAIETDLAELIIQLAHEESSHILVPAIHKNRTEIRTLFMRTLGIDQLSDDPAELAGVARQWQREGQTFSWPDLVALAEAAPPLRRLVDPDAPEFLNPGNMPAAIRDYCGRTSPPEPASVGGLVRCCLESLALKYRWVVVALEELTGRALETIRIVGGGSQNSLLCQLTADAGQRRVVAGPIEATALLNIVVQAVALGQIANIAAGRAAVAASERQSQSSLPAMKCNESSLQGMLL